MSIAPAKDAAISLIIAPIKHAAAIMIIAPAKHAATSLLTISVFPVLSANRMSFPIPLSVNVTYVTPRSNLHNTLVLISRYLCILSFLDLMLLNSQEDYNLVRPSLIFISNFLINLISDFRLYFS